MKIKRHIKTSIYRLGRSLSKEYVITINYSLPFISVGYKPLTDNSFWWTQGEDAQNLIDEIPVNVKPEYYLLWFLDNAGVFQNLK